MNAAAYIEAVSFAAPGLPDWPTAQAVLRGEQAYVTDELPVYQPILLPANERRRASATVRMAFRVAEAATQFSGAHISAEQLATVFSSSDGDLNIAQRICTALTETQRFISPTDFHNSVHNAAAGYWSIASMAKGPATAIAAFDHSFAVGLQEALGMVCVEQQSTLLVAYDVPSSMPLQAKRCVAVPVGAGLVLTPQRTPGSLAALRIETTQAAETRMDNLALEALRVSNPAARVLPLLLLLAKRESGKVVMSLPDNALALYLDTDLSAHE